MGQVRAEASLACTFLYIVSMVTDPKHNAGTFFPTRQLRWFTGCRRNHNEFNGQQRALKGQFTQIHKNRLSYLAMKIDLVLFIHVLRYRLWCSQLGNNLLVVFIIDVTIHSTHDMV